MPLLDDLDGFGGLPYGLDCSPKGKPTGLVDARLPSVVVWPGENVDEDGAAVRLEPTAAGDCRRWLGEKVGGPKLLLLLEEEKLTTWESCFSCAAM